MRRGARRGLRFTCDTADEYREEPSSRAFPGWRAEEIHLALTEAPMSEVAWRALERVALAMGAREGTEPDDDPLTRSQSARARREERMEMVLAALRARGIEAALDATEDRELLGRSFGREPDGGGARVYGRDRLPAAGAGAARPVRAAWIERAAMKTRELPGEPRWLVGSRTEMSALA